MSTTPALPSVSVRLFWASTCIDSPWMRSSATCPLPSLTASTQQSLLKSRETWIGALGGGGTGLDGAGGGAATRTGGGAAIGGAWGTFGGSLCRGAADHGHQA